MDRKERAQCWASKNRKIIILIHKTIRNGESWFIAKFEDGTPAGSEHATLDDVVADITKKYSNAQIRYP